MSSLLFPAIALQTAELFTLLDKPKVLPVFIGSKAQFVQAHIPGSVHISPQQLVCSVPPAAGKIPDADDLSELFSSIGMHDDSIIIAYDDEGGGWAGRLIWTLDVIGHAHYHFLDGGIIAWVADQLPVEQGDVIPALSRYTAHIDKSQLVTIDTITQQLNQPDFAIWDARSAEEYRGEKLLASRGGHIPGAANLDWLDLMDRSNHLRLKPLAEIKQMLEDRGINHSKRIVTHCQSHHRSGLTYLAGKLLDLDIRGYDGSWSEWGNHPETPVEL